MTSSNRPVIQAGTTAVSSTTAVVGVSSMQAQPASSSGSGIPGSRAALSDLITRIALTQDRDAFAKLFLEVAPLVKGMLVRQGAEHGIAEEITQETFLTVWRKAGLFVTERGSVITWIYTIARNLRIDRIRREVPWQELSDEHLEQASGEPLQDDQLASEQAQAQMRQALQSLPSGQLDVVMLAYADGLSHGEIALRLAIPLGTVKSRMRLAYQKIKESLPEAS
jgi:RNA polymerase sigma-70 factor, ECF subfamily